MPKVLQIRLVQGDLSELATEGVVNPANSSGEMGGGVAGILRRKGGSMIEKEAMQKAPIPIGTAVATTAGTLPCRFVIHAPTMNRPAERTDADRIARATQGALECADSLGLKQIAFPGMGTGVGRVPPQVAAETMVRVLENYRPRALQGITLVAFNQETKEAFERALLRKNR